MDTTTLLRRIAAMVKESGYPGVADVTVVNGKTVAITNVDGSANYLQIPHTQPANQPAPAKPSWPGYTRPAPAVTTGGRLR